MLGFVQKYTRGSDFWGGILVPNLTFALASVYYNLDVNKPKVEIQKGWVLNVHHKSRLRDIFRVGIHLQ